MQHEIKGFFFSYIFIYIFFLFLEGGVLFYCNLRKMFFTIKPSWFPSNSIRKERTPIASLNLLKQIQEFFFSSNQAWKSENRAEVDNAFSPFAAFSLGFHSFFFYYISFWYTNKMLYKIKTFFFFPDDMSRGDRIDKEMKTAEMCLLSEWNIKGTNLFSK